MHMQLKTVVVNIMVRNNYDKALNISKSSNISKYRTLNIPYDLEYAAGRFLNFASSRISVYSRVGPYSRGAHI